MKCGVFLVNLVIPILTILCVMALCLRNGDYSVNCAVGIFGLVNLCY